MGLCHRKEYNDRFMVFICHSRSNREPRAVVIARRQQSTWQSSHRVIPDLIGNPAIRSSRSERI